MWDAKQYDRFADDRIRPFYDLVRRVGAERPHQVVDLGCGTGAATASLAQRWPHARVTGIDNSTQMLDQAAQHELPGRLTFEQADLAKWTPAEPVDVLVSNAALQWVPGHRELLPAFVSWLAPGGWLAFQVPGNFRAPAHRLLTELRQSPRWRDLVGAGADRHLVVAEPAEYLAELAGLGCLVDAWETTYLHVLPGEDAVLDWMKGTGLRPVLDALAEPQQAEFLAEYGALLREEFPRRPWGTVLEFRRIFVVAHLDRD
ncbi:MAG: trans-aconitate 2-methyltransferase [Streptosporangiales bacterium]|nr:trans-aconitate 2-methyltransferase [Streptosporangiales bacterium]